MNKGGVELAGVIFITFVISILCLIGMTNYFMLSQKARVYPPKKVLLKKAGLLGVAGITLLVVGILLYSMGAK